MPIDKINPAAAAGVYSNTQKAGNETGVAGGESFGALVKKGLESSIDTLRAGEKASAEAVTGKADLTDVVQAVNKADMTLQTVVSLRDRMMSSYQEIMRMPI